MKNRKTILIALMFVSCTSGPKSKVKNPLNYLNGQNYQADVTSGVLPLSVKRKNRATLISGKAYFSDQNDDFKYPLRFQKVKLLKGNNVISTVTTDGDGNFNFAQAMDDGIYSLKIEQGQFLGGKRITISGYELKNVELQAVKQ